VVNALDKASILEKDFVHAGVEAREKFSSSGGVLGKKTGMHEGVGLATHLVDAVDECAVNLLLGAAPVHVD